MAQPMRAQPAGPGPSLAKGWGSSRSRSRERRKIMTKSNRNLLGLLLGGVLLAQANGRTDPPPVGAGIVATLQADQDVYTNQPASAWCPPCTTNNPPCMLPCY